MKGKNPNKAVYTALLCLLLSCVALLSACGAGNTDIAARFGDHEITEQQVEDYTADFRQFNSLTEDGQWASYLEGRSLTARTWREDAIRQLVDRMLVQEKAQELGISADQDEVAARIEEAKAQASIDPEDVGAWTEYLNKRGQTPEDFRQLCEFNVLEQQVFKHELDFTDKAENELCNEYIHSNLADQVLRRYSALEFAIEDEGAAKQCLSNLKGLSGDALVQRFEALATEAGGGLQNAGGDIGWDFIYDEGVIDPDAKLRAALLMPGELYGHVLVGQDKRRVVMCTERVEITKDVKFEKISSASFKDVIKRYVQTTLWAEKCNEYLAQLEKKAKVEVSEMPSGLSYDVSEG